MNNIPQQDNNLDTMLEGEILWTESIETPIQNIDVISEVANEVENETQTDNMADSQIVLSEKQKKAATKAAKEAEKEALKQRKALEKKNRPPTVWEKALQKYWFLLVFFLLSLIFFWVFSFMEWKLKEVYNNLDMESNSLAMDMDAEKAFLEKWSGNSVKIVDTPKIEEAYNNISDSIVLMQQFVDSFWISLEDRKIRLIVKKQLLDSEKIALMMLKYQSEELQPRLISGLWPKDVEIVVELSTNAQRKSLKQKEEEKLKEQLEWNKEKSNKKKKKEKTTEEETTPTT